MSDRTVTRIVKRVFWAAAVAGVIIAWILLGVGPCMADTLVRFRVTAFCPCQKCCNKHPSHPAFGITASGTLAHHPLVAAPPRFPFGTRIRVPGYAGGQWVRVEDRGGAIRGDRLDLLFPDHAAALRWGVRYITFRVRSGP